MVLGSKKDIQKLESKVPKKKTSDVELDVDNAYRITERLAFPRLKFVHTKKDNMSLASKEGIKQSSFYVQM